MIDGTDGKARATSSYRNSTTEPGWRDFNFMELLVTTWPDLTFV
jgi:hypothetical protein